MSAPKRQSFLCMVLRPIGGGFGTSRVAVELQLSVKTIGTHRPLIKQKRGLTNGAELTRRAAEGTLKAVRSRSGPHGMCHSRMRATR